MPVFVSAGEALTDLLRDGADSWTSQVGGSTWNVARVMARLGVPSAFAGAVSDDVFGDALARASADAGLDPRFLQQLGRSPLLAIVHQRHPPRYFFVGDDSADLHFDPGLLPAGWEGAASWVHFGGISLARPPLRDQLLAMAARLKQQGVSISYDPNYRALMDQRYDPVLRQMAALADVIKVSDEDLCGLFRCSEPEPALAALRAINPDALYLYTLGAAGARLLRGAQEWRAPAPAVAVADTVGAGDASIATLLYSLMRHPDAGLDQHLRHAVAGGAAACLGAGAAPPTLEQLHGLLPAVSVYNHHHNDNH
nr:carbohydrate kinase [Duganella violaceicalia]